MPRYRVDFEIIAFDSIEVEADSELEAADVVDARAKIAIERSNKTFKQRVEILSTYEIDTNEEQSCS
jgi:hypothetical protein